MYCLHSCCEIRRDPGLIWKNSHQNCGNRVSWLEIWFGKKNYPALCPVGWGPLFPDILCKSPRHGWQVNSADWGKAPESYREDAEHVRNWAPPVNCESCSLSICSKLQAVWARQIQMLASGKKQTSKESNIICEMSWGHRITPLEGKLESMLKHFANSKMIFLIRAAERLEIEGEIVFDVIKQLRHLRNGSVLSQYSDFRSFFLIFIF